MKKSYILPILALVILPLVGHAQNEPTYNYSRHDLDAAAISVPILEGWEEDTALAPNEGVVMRLNKPMPVPGAPRIDFYVQNKENNQPTLKEYINKNLKALSENDIHITYRDQRNLSFNGIDAVRLRYDYNLGSAKGPAISQVTYFYDRGDRLVMVSAFGRSELYLPLNDDIETIIRGCLPIVPGIKGKMEPISQGAQNFFQPRRLTIPDMITSASKVPPTTAKVEQIPAETKQ